MRRPGLWIGAAALVLGVLTVPLFAPGSKPSVPGTDLPWRVETDARRAGGVRHPARRDAPAGRAAAARAQRRTSACSGRPTAATCSKPITARSSSVA